MSRMTKERRADLEKLADEDPHMCLLRELLNEIDALQQESAPLLKEQVMLLRESLAGLCDPQLTSRDREDAIVRGLAALEETKEIEE